MLLPKPRRFAAPLLLAFTLCAHAETSASPLPDAPVPTTQSQDDQITLRDTPRRFLEDQKAIWTSPARIRESNVLGPLALVLATTVLISTDHEVMSSSGLNDPSLNSHASTVSNGLLGGFVATPALIYGIGHFHHDQHATETGILSGEAMADSLVVNEVMKLVSLRERPTVDDARGRFFQTSVGTDSSFPSTHSILAWSSAAVIASEYSGPLTQITAYSFSAGLSTARVLARQHFPSDVFVGSAVGWMIGRYVVHRHRKSIVPRSID
jgi:hypothetical protein